MPTQGTALLKGGSEKENIGDVMMRKVAQDILTSLGYKQIYTIGHWEDPAQIAHNNQIDGLFVLGSIQFSDAWKSPSIADRLARAIWFHKHFPSARVVFLPATWGAFGDEHAQALAELSSNSVFLVRDEFSSDNITKTLGAPVATYCPDLAFLYPTSSPEIAKPLISTLFRDPSRPLFGIIPNIRCIEPKLTSRSKARSYIEYLMQTRDIAVDRGYNVIGISHMRNTDRDIRILRELGIQCLPTDDLDVIRSAIANLSAAICSRYHGVISCLSHGVPLVALGWHHKYRNLMNDMKLGSYFQSTHELPTDPNHLVGDLLSNAETLRISISRTVTATRYSLNQTLSARLFRPRLRGAT